ncbi:hypothetical protein EIP86_009605 [Pleurotus ostreatoroseus]|nr:hypothetical protein EIP86_009605 [Pleurotus ostreatoroseus]
MSNKARRRRRPPLAERPIPELDATLKESDPQRKAVNFSREEADRECTPMIRAAPTQDHSRESVHPYVREDLRRAKVAPFFAWTGAALRLPKSKIQARARKIAQLRWFHDEIIQTALVNYVSARTEADRYDPFVHLANRILELARGNLPGVGQNYPVDNFCFAQNAFKTVRPTPEHGALAARRRPDIFGLSLLDALNLYKAKGCVGWPNILMWGELKLWSKALIETLNEERIAHGLTPLDSAGCPVDWPPEGKPQGTGLFAKQPPTAAWKGRKRPAAFAPQVKKNASGASSRVQIGRKRLEREDLLRNLDKGSSGKRRNSIGTSAEIHDDASAAIQSSSYALELLSGTQGTRTHCFGFVLKDDRITLWYYDASGVVYTQEFISMISDFDTFAALIIGFACCTTEQFGIMPFSILQTPTPSIAQNLPADLKGRTFSLTHPRAKREVTVTLEKPMFAQYALMGRRTFLYTIKTNSKISSKPLIAKFSYQACTRKAEQDLVAVARRAGVKHLPRIHMWAELWKLSDGVRQIFYENSNGEAAYEDRTLRAIVYTQYTSIKELFSHSPKLIPLMVLQLIDCLHDLRYKANMLHRDISVNNIMYQMRDGRHHFILIDFDMAIVLPTAAEGSLAASSYHRTGTLPYMSYELVRNASRSHKRNWKPIPHQLRHDYESLFWVALWCVLTLLLKDLSAERQEELVARAQSLEKGVLEQIAGIKLDICTAPLSDSDIILPPRARPLRGWFRAWGQLLLEVVGVVRRFRFASRAAFDASSSEASSDNASAAEDDADDDDAETEEDEDEDEDDEEEEEDITTYTSNPDWQTAGGLFTRDHLKATLTKAFKISEEPDDADNSEDSDIEDEPVDSMDQDEPNHETAIPQSQKAVKVIRSTRARKPRVVRPPPSQPAENDIRSRLRPRRPRVY